MKKTKKKNIHTRLKRLHQPRLRQQEAQSSSDETSPRVFDASADVDVGSPEVIDVSTPTPPTRSLEDMHDLYMESRYDVWLQAGARRLSTFEGDVMVFDRSTPATSKIGRYTLTKGQHLDLALGLSEDELPNTLSSLCLDDFCFLDLETSGLRYKDVAFCVGLGRWSSNVFHVKQYILPHEEDEKLQMQCALEAMEHARVLVTFNGKSFDVPRMIARCEACNLDAGFLKTLHHIDLMYVLRTHRGNRRKFGLKEMEADLLGLIREDDVPGHRAPALWDDYLKTGTPGELIDIFEHNWQDIVSMAALIGVAYGKPQPVSTKINRQHLPIADPSSKIGALSKQTPTRSTVHKKLARTYQLRANQQRQKQAANAAPLHQSSHQSTPHTDHAPQSYQPPVYAGDVSTLGSRLEQLRMSVEQSLSQGVSPAACLPQLTEIVALSPTHAFGLKHLALAYRALGMSACAQALEARLKSALPY